MQIPMEPIIVAPIPLPPSTTDPDNFDQRANEFLSALPDFQIDLNLIAENVYDNAMIVYDAALEIDSKTVIATQAATTATTAANTAGTALAQMQELYLGAKTAAPTLDNTGQPLKQGAWYTNITTGVWYWWSGTAWKIGVGDMTTVDWSTQVTNKPTNFLYRTDIVGTVGKVGGQPTGSIIQSGTNANGSYLRFADGTQICYFSKPITTITLQPDSYESLPAWGWTHPIAFVSVPLVILKLAGSYASQAGIAQNHTSATATYDIYIHNYFIGPAIISGPILFYAIGRWF